MIKPKDRYINWLQRQIARVTVEHLAAMSDKRCLVTGIAYPTHGMEYFCGTINGIRSIPLMH